MENTYWKIQEASEFLRTSKCNLYKLTMNSKIPHYKFGRSLRFKKEELIQLVELFENQELNKNI
jgi:excisionase family DNA binding protein